MFLPLLTKLYSENILLMVPLSSCYFWLFSEQLKCPVFKMENVIWKILREHSIWSFCETMCSPPWELELRPLGVATGNALSVTRVWRYICKNTTCWPATAHDVTTGVPQYKCRRENTSSAFSSSLTGLFEACNLVRVQFSLYQMASTSKAFKIVCGSASSLLTPDDTHNLCVFCLGKEHARDVLEGKSACTVSFFYVKAPLSSCPSFRGKRGSRLLPAIRDPPLPRHGGEWN